MLNNTKMENETDDDYTLQRKVIRNKKWSQVFTEKIEGHNVEQNAIQIYQQEKALESWALVIICRRVATNFRKRRMKIEHYYQNESANPRYQQPTFGRWEPHWGSQLLCCICNKPGFNDCVICKTCNMIAHVYCAKNSKNMTNKITKLKEAMDVIKPDKEYICSVCIDLLQEEKTRVGRRIFELKDEKMKTMYGKILAKRLVAFATRVKYLRQRAAVIKIQSVIRKFVARRKFQSWRKAQMRVIVVSLRDIPSIFDGHWVILAVIDTMKHTQLFRFDKPVDKTSDEAFLIPGITATVSLVITIVWRDENASLPTIKAQSQLALQDITNFLEPHEYAVRFSSSIQWPPTDTRRDKTLSSVILNVSYENCIIRYTPLNACMSLCAQAYGPPLDVLRKMNDMYTISKKGEGKGERRTKWWICLADFKLYFYQFFGDSTPRLSVSIRDASCTFSKTHSSTVLIVLGDRRKWQFDFVNPYEAHKLAFAIAECRHVVDGSSPFLRAQSLQSLYMRNY